MSKLSVVIVPVGAAPYQAVINDDLETIQSLVGGYFEVVSLGAGLLILCDDEAKIKNKPGNRRINHHIIAGQFIVVADGGEEFSSLSESQAQTVLKRFADPEEITPYEVAKDCKITVYSW